MNKRVLGGWAWCLCCSVGAQTEIPDPSAELQRQERQRQELRSGLELKPWSFDVGDQAKRDELLPHEHPCAQISRVVIEGHLSSAAMELAVNGPNGQDAPNGRCLGGQGVTVLIQRVQEALMLQGYITSHVQAPKQDLNTGILLLQIAEGRVARIRSEKGTEALPRLAWATQEGAVLNLRDIEQSSENFQRLPSLQAEIQIQPGDSDGTSDLVANLHAQRPLRLGLSLDDGGSRSTGRLQGNASLSWDNPFGLAHLFYVASGKDMGDRDRGPRGTRNRIVHYSVPWGYWLLSTTWSSNEYRQTVFGPYESYLYRGTSDQRELSLSRVLRRDGVSKTVASVKGFVRRSNNHIADLEVLVQRRRTAGWEAGLEHLQRLPAGVLTTQLTYRRGTGAFGAQAAPEEITGQGTGRMRLLVGGLHWRQPLQAEGQPWQYSAHMQWHWGLTRLTTQDQICLANRSAVRGFDGQQTLCGDRGLVLRQEIATELAGGGVLGSGLQAYLALDAGRANTPGQRAGGRLAGMSVGVRGTQRLGTAPSFEWEFSLGRPLSMPDGFVTARTTTTLRLRAEF